MSFSTFVDLKVRAYQIAIIGKNTSFNENWKKIYSQTESHDDSIVLKGMIDIYADYLKGDLSKPRAIGQTKKLERDFNDVEYSVKSMMEFGKARNRAFRESDVRFGTVSFVCPLCQGDATATRKHTPETPSNTISTRARCTNCGYSTSS